jgi:erythritol transport system ATP-binding protein
MSAGPPANRAPASLLADVVLAAEGVTKSFDGIRALDDVTFQARRAEINVLVGENGAGKSTLMKILSGAERPDSGQILLDSVQATFSTARDAIRQGIGVIHQELSLMPNLSVAENIFAGRELRRGRLFVDLAAERRRSADLLRRLGQRVDPAALAGELPVGQQQLVEIAKALAGDLHVLIMDEPTSALSSAEVDVLFQVMRDLRRDGLTIIYISHRLEELRHIGDSVTVLRDGRVIARRSMAQASTAWIAEQMIGRELGSLPARNMAEPGPEALRVTGLSAVPDAGTAIRDIDFSLAAGEIVGIYGLLGAGRTELLEVLAGSRPRTAGEIFIGGAPSTGSGVATRLERGVTLVPEDRQRDGLVPTLPVRDNILLASLRQLVRRGLISRRVAGSLAGGQATALRIKVPALGAPVTALSGGNQQKVLIARALLTKPKVLLLDEPTRGIDVGAKGEVFRIMHDLSRQGMGVLFTSSDLGEVLSISDRILVMTGGRISRRFSAEEATEGDLARAASASHVSEVTK